MPTSLSDVTNAEFLNEPAWKWFIAFGAMLLFLWAWKGILSFI